MNTKDLIVIYVSLIAVNAAVFLTQKRDGSVAFLVIFAFFLLWHVINFAVNYPNIGREERRKNAVIFLIGYPVAGFAGYLITSLIT